LTAASPRFRKRRRAAEEPLAQDLHRETARSPPTLVAAGHKGPHPGPEQAEGLAEGHFLWGQGQHEGARCVARAELRRRCTRVYLTLQPAEHDLLHSSLLGRLQLARLGKPDRV